MEEALEIKSSMHDRLVIISWGGGELVITTIQLNSVNRKSKTYYDADTINQASLKSLLLNGFGRL